MAHLLATTAAIVGVDRAVTAAIDGVGTEQVAAALPLLQPGVFSDVTKTALDRAEAAGILAELSRRAPPPRSAPNLRSSRSCTG